MVIRRISHSLYFMIEFKNPVDYFDVILQKQIDLRLQFEKPQEKNRSIDILFFK